MIPGTASMLTSDDQEDSALVERLEIVREISIHRHQASRS